MMTLFADHLIPRDLHGNRQAIVVLLIIDRY